MNGAVALIARREITTRLQQRGFRIGFAAALLIAVIACVLPSFFGSDDKATTYDIGVPTQDRALRSALTSVADNTDIKIVFHPSGGAAEDKVHDGDWDAAVLPGGRLIAENKDSDVVAVVQESYRVSRVLQRLGAAGLSASQASKALSVSPLRVTATKSAKNNQRQAIAVITVIVLFSQLVTFCTWVAMGVVEEKASRVVELVLSSVRPKQLLAGKLLGIGLLAAAQVLLLGVVALTAASLAGTFTLPASGIATVAVGFVGFVLGFAFFAALAAALASTVSRQEELSGILTPVTLSVTVCYGLSFAATSNPGSTFARVISIVPPVSSLAMPARIAHGGVPTLDIVLAVVLLVAAAFGTILVAGRVYRASVLHSGTRVPLRRAWRGEAVADIA